MRKYKNKILAILLSMPSLLLSAQQTSVQNPFALKDVLFSEFKCVTVNGDTLTEKNLSGKITFINFRSQNSLSCIDRGECNRLLARGFPTSIIVDQSGKVAFMHHGGSLDKTKINETKTEYEKRITDLFKK